MLCDYCQEALRQPFETQAGDQRRCSKHTIEYKLSTLRLNARRCSICGVIHKEHSTVSLYNTSEDISVATSFNLTPYNGQLGYATLMVSSTLLDKSYILAFQLYRVGPNVPEDDSELEATTHTGATESLKFALRCLKDCLQSHALCKANIPDKIWIPARLIKIDGQADDIDCKGLSARLVLTKELGHKVEYASLSHCWGDVNFETLLEHNLEDMKHDIDIEALSLTFREALYVLGRLKLQYIWIDSLCIVQDSIEDWQAQSSQMFEIYRHAVVNIAATKSTNGEGGLFTSRQRSIVTSVVEITQPECSGMFQLVDHSLWDKRIDKAPLNQRAWVVQERLLSQRTLHFTSDQLIWDCAESARSEVFLDDFNPWSGAGVLTGVQIQGPKRNFNLLAPLRSGNGKSSADLWAMVVHAYSQSNLTFASDVMIALAGITRHFEWLLQDQYCAGFWFDDLAFHLTWYPAQHSPVLALRQAPAPSWSWLSLRTSVTLPLREFYEGEGELVTLIQILDVDIKRTETDQGSVFRGHLLVRGALTPLSAEVAENEVVFDINGEVLEPFASGKTRVHVMEDFDWTAQQMHNHNNHYFFLPC